MRVDAHQHFWKLSRGDYDWLTDDLAKIRRDFLPEHLKPHLAAAGVDRTILVQAAETLAETEFLLRLADENALIGAVVGWVDLGTSQAKANLDRLALHPRLKGIRPVLQDMADPLFVLHPEVLADIAHAHELGLRFDALIRPRHLPVITALADRFPGLPIVVDHVAKPFIAKGVTQPWGDDFRALARRGNVCVKISGMVTEAADDWTAADLRPYVDHLKDLFGAHRLMFGSDWPVLELAGTYEGWHSAVKELTSLWTAAEQADFFGGTAARFYGIQ